MAFLDAKANTSYSYVDQQLSWVLWLYSIIWMPLLLFTCFKRSATAKSSRQASSSSSSIMQQQEQQYVSSGTPKTAAAANAVRAVSNSSSTPTGKGKSKPFITGASRSAPMLAQQDSFNTSSRRDWGGPRDSRETARTRSSQQSARDSFGSSMYRTSQELTHYGVPTLQQQHQQLPWSGTGSGSDGGRQQGSGGRVLRRAATIAAATAADKRSFGSPVREDYRGRSSQQQLQITSKDLHLGEQQQVELSKIDAGSVLGDRRGGMAVVGVVKRVGSDGAYSGGERNFGSGGNWDVTQVQDQH